METYSFIATLQHFKLQTFCNGLQLKMQTFRTKLRKQLANLGVPD